MKKKIRIFCEGDNTAVALEALQQGDVLISDGRDTGITALRDIPQGHKVALTDIPAGGAVRKYAHLVGSASAPILRGDYVHVHNVLDAVNDWRGSSRSHPYDPGTVQEISDEFLLSPEPKLTGYRRRDGSVGFRNYVLVVSTCVCGNQPVEDAKIELRDYKDIVFITNPSGCIILPNDRRMQEQMLLGLARNPNVGAVIFVGLGCESVGAENLKEQFGELKPAAFFVSQQYESGDVTTAELVRKALEFREELSQLRREPVTLSDIRVGTQCGASDWTTGAAANPAIGYCSDLIVKNGGISVMGETCGWFGGEEILLRQARTKEVADDIITLMEKIYDRCLFFGHRVDEANPAPGNIAGGITTLCEKALGNTLKGGTAPIEGVLEVGQQPPAGGYYLSDNPGLDAVSVFAQTMSSCNVIVYSTGRGAPVGTPIAPVIKLTASPTAAEKFGRHMDVILTDLVLEGVPIPQGGRRLFDKLIAVCNGEETIAEKGRHREYAFPLMMGPM